jgi:hypothetical protein
MLFTGDITCDVLTLNSSLDSSFALRSDGIMVPGPH